MQRDDGYDSTIDCLVGNCECVEGGDNNEETWTILMLYQQFKKVTLFLSVLKFCFLFVTLLKLFLPIIIK